MALTDDEWLLRRIAPGKTVLLVIDMQNDFCAPGGWYDRIGHGLQMSQRAVARTAEVLPVARDHGMLVVFVRCTYDRPFVPPVMAEAYERKGIALDLCQEGTWGAEFFGVMPAAGDVIITKHRYSAFVHTNLEALLRANMIENLLLTGVATNICVDSTARDGYMLDYRVTLLEDCCGSYDQSLHEATLENVRRAFGVVATSGDVARVLGTLQAPSRQDAC